MNAMISPRPITVHSDLYHFSEYEVIQAQFYNCVIEHINDPTFTLQTFGVDSEADWSEIEEYFVTTVLVRPRAHYGFGNREGVYLSAHNEGTSFFIRVAGPAVDVESTIDKFLEILRPIEVRPSTIPYTFWCLNAKDEPRHTVKRLGGNEWDEVRVNYPPETRETLDKMITLRPPEGGGKIILWHGVPGTGKTNFIRALATSWQEWCSIEYVLDPEQMFDRAHYMNSVFIDAQESDKWRLMILEDSGEFVLEKSKLNLRQGFSRLLNLADGIMGQGLKLIILITTNEPMKALHPAITRPGRCLANIEFGLFSRKEATEWLGYSPPPGPDYDHVTLASLYELRAAEQQINRSASDLTYRPGVYA